MSTLLHDLRSARRLLTRNPTFTAVAVLTLGLGIGLNTAVFSTIDALLLRPLPNVRAPEEVVQLYREWPGISYGSWSPMNVDDVRERGGDVFSDVAAWNFVAVNLSADGRTQRVFGQQVSANYFATMGSAPFRGRTFGAAEDRNPGGNPVVVLSHSSWQGMFGGDPEVIGKSIVMNGAPYTVIGIMPAGYRSPIPVITPALFVPLTQLDHINPEAAGSLTRRGSAFMQVVARLKPGVTPGAAAARLAGLVPGLVRDFPDDYRNSTLRLVPQSQAGIHPQMRGAQVGLTGIVMGVVIMLLLIACVNVANLFLARARDRWREMAIRLSLGARRGVLVRQLLVESLVFAAMAGSAGLAIAWGSMRLLNNIRLPLDAEISADLQLSVPVLVFSALVTLATGVLFGLAPALQATRPSLLPALKGESLAGDARSRGSRALVVAQMALSLVLLVGAGLFLRNLGRATSIDKGFDQSNLLLAELEPGLQGYSRERGETFFRALGERLAAAPNVKAVSFARSVPLGLSNSQSGVQVPGYTAAADEQMSIDYNIVSPGYFETMGIRVLRGRGFTARDDSAAPPVLVVNQRFAERFWPGQDPVGKTVRTRSRDHTVIGLVPSGKYRTLGESPLAYMYYAHAQRFDGSMVLQVRTTVNPELLTSTVRAEVAALDPDLPVSNMRTMSSHLGIALMPSRLAGGALGVFGLIGLLLAAVGIYGVMAYSVSQRTREIGIRMAMGASRGNVVSLIMRQGLRLVAIGGVVGLALALGVAQVVKGLLYGGNALDAATFLGVPLVLATVAALAVLVPARRAASVEPVQAIRSGG